MLNPMSILLKLDAPFVFCTPHLALATEQLWLRESFVHARDVVALKMIHRNMIHIMEKVDQSETTFVWLVSPQTTSLRLREESREGKELKLLGWRLEHGPACRLHKDHVMTNKRGTDRKSLDLDRSEKVNRF